jgi:uncharacterized protein (DUF2252 family)
MPILEARREAKMTSSAHAYVRGSTGLFYEWLGSKRGRSLPDAPTVWIGGDCHVGNLGPVATNEGGIAIELRDLDQTVLGSPAHDVVRLGLSLAMAVRASNLPGIVALRTLESLARGYERVLEAKVADQPIELGTPPLQVLKILRASARRSRKQLFAERLGQKSIAIGRRFWPLTDVERSAVEEFVGQESTRELLTQLTTRPDDAEAKLLDAAYWVKGCSSLGKWRCAALVQIGKGRNPVVALIDLKEAHAPLAPRGGGARMPRNHGQRVVTGARALSPALGARMVSGEILGVPVFAREIMPQDSKFELESLGEEEAVTAGEYLAAVVARAHARQLQVPEAAAWLAEFRKKTAKATEVPTWLWSSVVDLVSEHEGAYLEQCRVHGRGQTVRATQNDPDVVRGRVTGE